jgi:ubiquinone biosynthesis protein
MHLFSFLRLMRMIQAHRKPDLEWIQDQGLLAVKIAQHYALRVDFLDPKVCESLSLLFRSARPAPAANVSQLLQGLVGPEWFQHFSQLDEQPFAVASVGQVHHAMLRDGRPVVVKIIKSDHAQAFVADVQHLRSLVRIALLCMPRLQRVFNPRAVLDHISEYTLHELDLRHEIEGSQTLAGIAAGYAGRVDLSRLRLPQYIPECCTRRVLVSELIVGSSVDELLRAGRFAYQDLLSLFQIHGTFLFAAGTFHGDLHPGNVILDSDGRFAFVDTAAISQAPPRIRRGLFAFFRALVARDLEASVDALVFMSLRPMSLKRLEQYRLKFRDLYSDFFGRSVAEASLTRQMMRTIRSAVEAGMEFDQGMFPVIKSLMYLDGMVLRCRPEAVLIDDLAPFLEGFVPIMEET